MINDRPIENPRLQKALNEVRQVFDRYGFAGTAMIISEDEGAFFYRMHANWSALRYDPNTPLGFRLRAVSAEDGPATSHKRVEGAMHTICQLLDFGFQTEFWMEDLCKLARDNGIDFEHTPFGGRPLPHIYGDDQRR